MPRQNQSVKLTAIFQSLGGTLFIHGKTDGQVFFQIGQHENSVAGEKSPSLQGFRQSHLAAQGVPGRGHQLHAALGDAVPRQKVDAAFRLALF